MKFLKSLFLTKRLLTLGLVLLAFAVAGFVLNSLYMVAKLGTGVLAALVLLDILFLYRIKQGIKADRQVSDRLSNGDDNPIHLWVENRYAQSVAIEVIDEAPEQFQLRNLVFERSLTAGQKSQITYFLRPVKRGAYEFGGINVFAQTALGLIKRKYHFGINKEVAVYPAFLQMHKYELLAFTSLPIAGIKKIRRIGHNQEFEQIKDYVQGDDYRTLNWRASARAGKLMVNTYQDERSQQVMCLIDKGRLMHMPFEEMSLLDWAINASLVISNIALKKGDKVGLVSFQHKVQSFVMPSNRNRQMAVLMEQLYKQKTAFKEADFSRLYLDVRHKLPQRSLLLMFTNFESLQSMQRQLPYLQKLARRHLLVVIFFENTELKQAANTSADSVEEIYSRTIIEKLLFEKKLIVKELQKHGIQAMLTQPQKLTVNTINKYLELKARGLI